MNPKEYSSEYFPNCVLEAHKAGWIAKIMPAEYISQIRVNVKNYFLEEFKKELNIYNNNINIKNHYNELYDFGKEKNCIDHTLSFSEACFLVSCPNIYCLLLHIRKDFAKEIGCVYIIENNGFYKIGRTANLNSRIKTYYRTENPNPYQLIAEYSVFDHINLEKTLHKRFQKHNHNREWFKLDNQDLEQIELIVKPFLYA